MKAYILEYRKIKKNVPTFGLKTWFEGIALFVDCNFEKITNDNIQHVKILQNLGKVQSRKNSIKVPNKKGIIELRPQNMFENIEDMITFGKNIFKHHMFTNKFNNEIPFIVYNKQLGILNNIDTNDNTTDNSNINCCHNNI